MRRGTSHKAEPDNALVVKWLGRKRCVSNTRRLISLGRFVCEDGSGSVDFREFVMSLWNYCTLSKAALIMFAFDLYDNDNSGEIDTGEVELLLKEVYGREFQSNTQAQAIMAKIRGGDLSMDRNINVFVLQTQMQEKILGTKFWVSCSNARVELSSGEYIDIAGILQAHVNEKVRYAEQAVSRFGVRWASLVSAVQFVEYPGRRMFFFGSHCTPCRLQIEYFQRPIVPSGEKSRYAI